MATIMKTRKANGKDGKNSYIVTGMVNGVYPSETNPVTNVSLTLDRFNPTTKVWVKQYLDVSFWEERAERINSSLLEKGNFATFIVGEIKKSDYQEGEVARMEAKGFQMIYNGIVEDDDGIVVTGKVRKLKVSPEKMNFVISVKVWDKEKKENSFKTISFTAKDKVLASLLKKDLKDGDVVAVAGSKDFNNSEVVKLEKSFVQE